MFCTYSILESPMGVENYVATLRLTPVTDGEKTFLEWSAEFDCAPERETELINAIGAACFRAASMRSSACSEAESVPHIVKSTILDAPTGVVWNVLRDSTAMTAGTPRSRPARSSARRPRTASAACAASN